MKLLEGIVTLEELKSRTETRKKLMNGFNVFNGKIEGYFTEKVEDKYKIIGSWSYVDR